MSINKRNKFSGATVRTLAASARSFGPRGGKALIFSPVLVLLLAVAGCGGGGAGTSSSLASGAAISNSGAPASTPASTPASVTSPTAKIQTLTWNAPTTNALGTAINDLKGYKIYYGTSSGNYGTPVDTGCGPCPSSCPGPAPAGTACTYNLQSLQLPAGTYYFSVTSYNSSGKESDYSNETVKIIN